MRVRNHLCSPYILTWSTKNIHRGMWRNASTQQLHNDNGGFPFTHTRSQKSLQGLEHWPPVSIKILSRLLRGTSTCGECSEAAQHNSSWKPVGRLLDWPISVYKCSPMQRRTGALGKRKFPHTEQKIKLGGWQPDRFVDLMTHFSPHFRSALSLAPPFCLHLLENSKSCARQGSF